MYKELIERYSTPQLSVYFVDGAYIRSHPEEFGEDAEEFTEDGHWLRYPWIPEHEEWIDTSNSDELPFILLHGLHEINAMIEMINALDSAPTSEQVEEIYDICHTDANVPEQEARHNPDQADSMIIAELNKLSSRSLESKMSRTKIATKKTLEIVYKTLRPTIIKADDKTGIIDMLIPMSTGTEDRSEEVILPSAWTKRLPEFKKRAILVSSHNYGDLRKQIGELLELKVDKEGLYAKPQYYINQGNDEADWGYKLASKGMAAYSVGFKPWDFEEGMAPDEPSITYTDCELLEISHVIVPCNQESIQGMRGKSKIMDSVLDDMQANLQDLNPPMTKGALPYHKTSLAPEDTTWDAGVEVKKAEISDLKAMCAWVGGDPENKSSYKLPHHKADGEHACVWKGVAAAAAVLQGGRGGADIDDVDAVKAHIAKHYGDFDKGDPPWKKDAQPPKKKLTQAQIRDEMDYLILAIDESGIAEETKDMADKLIKRITGGDTPVKIEQKAEDNIKIIRAACKEAIQECDKHHEGHSKTLKGIETKLDEMMKSTDIKVKCECEGCDVPECDCIGDECKDPTCDCKCHDEKRIRAIIERTVSKVVEKKIGGQ